MIVAISIPIVSEKRDLDVLSVLARVRWFRDRKEWHLQIHVGRDVYIDLLVGLLRQQVDSAS